MELDFSFCLWIIFCSEYKAAFRYLIHRHSLSFYEEPRSPIAAMSFPLSYGHFGYSRSPKWYWSLRGGNQILPICLCSSIFLKECVTQNQSALASSVSLSEIQYIIPPLHRFMLKYYFIYAALGHGLRLQM